MPYDSEGNLTTAVTVNVETIFDKMKADKIDVIPLFNGGMARVAEDKKDGEGVVLTANTSPVGP